MQIKKRLVAAAMLIVLTGGAVMLEQQAVGSQAQALSPAASLGQQIFFDKALSASGQQSCGTCHVPARAFSADPATDHGLPVALGGPNMDLPGVRNTPSLMYLSFTPKFHFESDGTPVGGFFLDGRSPSLADQAQKPFVSSFEMANADAAEVIARLKSRPYLAQFEKLYGSAVLNDSATALARMGAALAAFESEASAFHPFSSKFDWWRRGKAVMSPQELNGFALFNSPMKGNCAACHSSRSANGVTPPLFTDFSFDNLGLPRNPAIPANDDATRLDYVPVDSNDGVHSYYDLGLCGPFRDDLRGDTSSLCGMFKVPSLRNVALTAPYFHNGVFASLNDAVGFYVRRDTNPEQWFPAAAAPGHYVKFDDLPAANGGRFVVDIHSKGSDSGYRGNVNTTETPYNRRVGQLPALTPAEIRNVVAFLCTLTDGYDPARPIAYNAGLPAQCPQSTAVSGSAH